MNLAEIEELIGKGPGLEEGELIEFAFLKVLAFNMKEDPEKYPDAKSAVIGRIEAEAEIGMTMGLSGAGLPDFEEFGHWVELAKKLGVTHMEAAQAVDRGAYRAAGMTREELAKGPAEGESGGA
jgi:hypothetical protein